MRQLNLQFLESLEHIHENIAALLYSRLQGKYKGCSKESVQDYLNIVGDRNEYNPILELLSAVEFDGKDHLKELYKILHIENDNFSQTLVKKWLLQCIALQYNTFNKPFGADGCLVLIGKQGIGKTAFFRKLAIKPEFFGEGAMLNTSDKDTIIAATSKWICELGEIESTFSKSDVARLKAIITQAVDELRLPYARKAITPLRRTSFCATCNTNDFLVDTTGNRRFWTIAVDSIDLEKLTDFDSLQLWKQIQAEVLQDLQSFRLTTEEQQKLTERNSAHEKALAGQSEVEDILSKDGLVWEEMTVSDFKNYFFNELRNISNSQIGKVLDRYGFTVKIKKVDGKTKRLRNLPRLISYT